MKFTNTFWPKACHAMFLNLFNSISIPVFFNLNYFTKQSVLVGFSGGDRAREIENFSDFEIIETTMKTFKKIFATQYISMPESYASTRWSKDPFAYGSYSYIAADSSVNDHALIAEPISNKLFFAGEATSKKHAATTHGAYLSGIREAERISACIST